MALISDDEVDTDPFETFALSFLKKMGEKPQEIQELVQDFYSIPGSRQNLRMKLAGQLMQALQVFSDMTTFSPYKKEEPDPNDTVAATQFVTNMIVARKSIAVDLMGVYTTFLKEKFFECEGHHGMVVVIVREGFGFIQTSMGSPDNTALRYLEEALGLYLINDDDFLGTFLRALELMEKVAKEIDNFGWISGEIELKEENRDVVWSDWEELVYRPYMEFFDNSRIKEENKAYTVNEEEAVVVYDKIPTHWPENSPEGPLV